LFEQSVNSVLLNEAINRRMHNMAAPSPRRWERWTEREQIAPILHASTRRVRVSFRIELPNMPVSAWRKGL
jgi:hypothetical protein